MRRSRTYQFALGVGAALGIALFTSGCSWKSYAVSRAVRHFTGAKMREHVILPLETNLQGYRVIELHEFSNMLPGRVPTSMERYLGDRMAGELSRLPTLPAVERLSALDLEVAAVSSIADSNSTLVIDGFLDDYDAGSRPLRIVELGFNHLAVTIRVQLHDKHSSGLLGAVSITAEDDRETGTLKGAIDRITSRLGQFVGKAYAH